MATAILHRFEAAIQLAAAQGGFITTKQLRDLNVPQQTASRWCGQGLLHRFDRGVYRISKGPYGFESALDLGNLLASDQQALGERTALTIHGLPGGHKSTPVLIGPQVHSRSKRIKTVRVKDLASCDIIMQGPLAVTTPLRSILDSAPHCSTALIGEQLTAGVQQQLFTYQDATARTIALSRRGKSGLGKVREVLALRIEDPACLLGMYEAQALRVIRRGRFPKPIAQYKVIVDGRTFYLDFAWPWLGKYAECDSMLAHSTPEQLQNDLDRQNVLLTVPLLPIRFTFWDVFRRPDRMIETLARHLPQTGEGW